MATRNRFPEPTALKVRPVEAGDMIGAIELHGMFGGALCWHYRIESIANGRTTLVRVEPRSVRNSNGTFSTVYEAAS
jgi:hypothetical protein